MIKFEPRDCWIGVYWNREEDDWYKWIKFYVCIVPCVVVIFEAFHKPTGEFLEGINARKKKRG